ncbi:hypothetical protein ACP8HI_12000 [Paenibacillus sp. FA6]|uniref:hypothetical protein n=1 Tax=Paenibacillus sp. FA6 TaxID=3413029 RepID=UPI003F65A4D9
MSTRLSRVETQKKRRLEGKMEKKQWKKVWLPLALRKDEVRRDSVYNLSTDEPTLTEDDNIPSRLETYNSNNAKISRIFLNTLIFLFVMLTVGLLWWGLEDAPPWKEIWR